MKKLIFVLILACFLAGCPELAELNLEDGVKVEVRGDESLPVQIEMQDDEHIPVQLDIPSERAIPVVIKSEEGKLLPVEVKIKGDEVLAVQLGIQGGQQLPVEVKVPKEIFVVLAIILVLFLFIAGLTCRAAKLAADAAKAVQRLTENSK